VARINVTTMKWLKWCSDQLANGQEKMHFYANVTKIACILAKFHMKGAIELSFGWKKIWTHKNIQTRLLQIKINIIQSFESQSQSQSQDFIHEIFNLI
jgi:hypothetical protein